MDFAVVTKAPSYCHFILVVHVPTHSNPLHFFHFFFLRPPLLSVSYFFFFYFPTLCLFFSLFFSSSSSSSSISMNTKSCSSTASFGYSLRFYEFPIADSLPVSMNVINCLQHLFSGFSFSFSFFYISRLFDIICWFIHFKYEIDDFWKKNGSYRQYFSLLYCIRF